MSSRVAPIGRARHEVQLAADHRVLSGGQSPVIGRQVLAGGDREQRLVDPLGADRHIRVEPDPERRRRASSDSSRPTVTVEPVASERVPDPERPGATGTRAAGAACSAASPRHRRDRRASRAATGRARGSRSRAPARPARRRRRCPSNEYRPSSSRFGQGASTCPRPAPTTARRPRTRRSRRPPSAVEGPERRADLRHDGTQIAVRDLELGAGGRSSASRVALMRPAPLLTAPSRSAISVRCVNACGMLPISRLFTWSYSSENSPRSFRNASSRSNSCLGLVAPADHREVDHEPEAAGEERTLARRQAVGGVVVGDVPHHEPVLDELALDRLDGPDDAGVVGRQEPDLRDQAAARRRAASTRSTA